MRGLCGFSHRICVSWWVVGPAAAAFRLSDVLAGQGRQSTVRSGRALMDTRRMAHIIPALPITALPCVGAIQLHLRYEYVWTHDQYLYHQISTMWLLSHFHLAEHLLVEGESRENVSKPRLQHRFNHKHAHSRRGHTSPAFSYLRLASSIKPPGPDRATPHHGHGRHLLRSPPSLPLLGSRPRPMLRRGALAGSAAGPAVREPGQLLRHIGARQGLEACSRSPTEEDKNVVLPSSPPTRSLW
jgi:hypothetical protein